MLPAGFLPEEEAAGGYAVLQGNGMDADFLIFIDPFVPGRVNGMEMERVLEYGCRDLKLDPDDLFQWAVSVKVQFLLASEQMKGGQESDQAIVVIAVKVADQDVADPLEVDMLSSKLQLCPFGTVN